MSYTQTLRDEIKNTRKALDKLESIIDFLDSVSEEVKRKYSGKWVSGTPAIKLIVSEETFDMLPGKVIFDHMKTPVHSHWLPAIYFINKEFEKCHDE